MIRIGFLSWLMILVLACSPKKEAVTEMKPSEEASLVEQEETPILEKGEDEPPPPPPEGRTVLVYNEGKMTKMVESQVKGKEYSIIDLSNYWVPFLFSEQSHPDEERKPNYYRTVFRKLANNWPYESPSIREAKKLYEEAREASRNRKIAALRAEGLSQQEINERLGIKTGQEEVEGEEEESGEKDDEDSDSPGHSGAGEEDHFLENYGIPPTLSVLRKRVQEELDRPCFDEIDYRRIHAFTGFVAYRSNEQARKSANANRWHARQLRKEMERLEIEDSAFLLEHPKNKLAKRHVELGQEYEAMVEAQKLLVCEGLYEGNAADSYQVGGLDWKTHKALVAFERKNRIFAWGFLGSDTLTALGKPPADRLYDSFVRVLSERIVDATRIIEDGSAVQRDGSKASYKNEKGEKVKVPNLVAEFTALAIKHLDLGTPEKVRKFLLSFDDEKLDTLFVAIALPPPPPYYSDNMDMHVRLHRGDVWYDYPYVVDKENKREFKRVGQPRRVMPTTTLYVKWNAQDIPLVTMNTTIGSWRTELAPDGYEYLRYKNSDVGPRVWQKILAGPVWLPPESTPIGDLTRRINYRGRVFRVPNYSEFGPHYGSAYGLVAGFHYGEVKNSKGEVIRYTDNGIRSHGSVDYNSILRRYSHGCHRLYNHLAIRLFNYVLLHKEFDRIGQIPAGFARRIETTDGNVFNIRITTRGYRYELKDPVPIIVEEGNVRGRQKTPIVGYMPKPGVKYGEDATFLPEKFKYLTKEEDTDSSTDIGIDSVSAIYTDSSAKISTDTQETAKKESSKSL